MVVSNYTAMELARTVRKYVSDDKIDDFLRDIKAIKGNASFVATMTLLEEGLLNLHVEQINDRPGPLPDRH